ncbi:MAG: hypothetical protein ACK4OM_05415 [Alphaproteobacteria bacterium]
MIKIKLATLSIFIIYSDKINDVNMMSVIAKLNTAKAAELLNLSIYNFFL